MSEQASPTVATDEPVTLETGLEALQSSPEFRGPVEPLEDHAHANDHFALIYESQAEQFAAAIPFVRQGLERGERCLYITYENSRDEVVAAMRNYDIDVDAALDSGQLSIHDEAETYLRNGTFDADETIEFLDAAIEEATEEYEALRVTGEMSSVLAEDSEGEELVKCEAKANYLFDDVDGLALCQYNRNRFSPDVIRDVISTHPLLIHDNRVSYNLYYTPPEEFFGPEKSAHEVDRLLRSLREQTDAKVELQRRERYLRESYEITSDPARSFEEKLDALFELGCERFDLDFGFLNRVDPAADRLVVEHASDDHEHYDVGGELPLSETYCQAAVDIKEAASISNPSEEGFDDRLVYEKFGVEGYLGTYIPVDGGADRTLAFVPAADSRSTSVSEQDRAYLELMGQWVGYELNRRQREQFVHECYEITSDPALDFEAKLHQLLDLARERMDLDAAGLTHLPEWDGKFLQEYAIGYGADGDGVVDASDDVWTDPSEGCYCRRTIVEDEPIGMADVRGTEWEDDEIHREHDLTCYLGTKVTSGSTPYGTLWVGSAEPRDREFSETERTFLELMGQWVSYELERRQRERELERALDLLEKTERIADVGGWEIDVETQDVFWTDHIFELLEVAADEEPPLEEALDMYHEEDQPIVEGAVENALVSGDPFDVEVRVRTASDEVRWLRLQGVPETVGDEVVSFRGAAQDVTEQKERERDLEETERRFEAIFEDPNILVGLLEPDGTVLDINQTAMEYIDADLDEVTDEPFWETPWWGEGDEVQSDVKEWTERAAAGEYVDFEADLTRPDGQRYTLNGVFRPVTNDEGDVVSVIVSDRDITERKERERALEQSEQRYRTLAESFPNGIVTLFDDDLRSTLAAGQAFDDLPVSPDDVEGRKPREAWDDNVADAIEPLYRAALDGEENSVELSYVGREWVVHVVPITDEHGDVLAGMTMAQDITERKENQRKLREQNERLESFASMLAHELRNPVTIGQIYSQQLPDEMNAEAVDYVTEAFDRIEDMIDVMLVLTRGREAVGEPTPVELADVTREAWDDTDAPDATLDVELDQTIQADETYVRHVIRNLLENAVEHGGPDVTVTVGELPSGFYVADDGPGILAEERDAVFDQGYTTAADSGGTGLGLAFVRKLADVYEWDYTVTESEEGGARFEFWNVI